MKKVCGCMYAHKSNIAEIVEHMDYEDSSLLSWAVNYMYYHNLSWDVCKYDTFKHTVSLIQCPTWDVRYEPVVGDSYVFKKRSEAPRIIIGSKAVYHRKHEFVSDDYDGFNWIDSKKRTDLLESILWVKENKSRIGSKRIWEEFLKEYNLPKYMI